MDARTPHLHRRPGTARTRRPSPVVVAAPAAAAAVTAAVAAERARIARELHDSVLGALDGIALCAQAMVEMLDSDPDARLRARQLAERLAADAATAGRDARGLVHALRADDGREPLAAVVRRLVAEWAAQTGTAVDVHVSGRPELPTEDRHQLLRVLREALHNVHKHAGAATVRVGLGMEAGRVLLTVADDGRGCTAPQSLDALAARGCYGLIGMFERAAAVAATVTVHGRPGRGTTVAFRSAPAPAPSGAGQPRRPALAAVRSTG